METLGGDPRMERGGQTGFSGFKRCTMFGMQAHQAGREKGERKRKRKKEGGGEDKMQWVSTLGSRQCEVGGGGGGGEMGEERKNRAFAMGQGTKL